MESLGGGGQGEEVALKGSCPDDLAPPHLSHPKVELLQAVINYLMPTLVVPKINGKKLWRNHWFSVLVRTVGLLVCGS